MSLSNPSDSQTERKSRILQLIYRAMDEVNQTSPDDEKVENSEETVLLGAGGGIDSLKLTMLIVSIEQKVEEEFKAVISLVDSSTMSEETSPFRKVRFLVEYIDSLLEGKTHV